MTRRLSFLLATYYRHRLGYPGRSLPSGDNLCYTKAALIDTCRCFASETPPPPPPPQKKSFLSSLIENVQEEMAKNKALKENLEKLKQEAERLESSDAIRKARSKYQQMEVESAKSTEQLKEKAQSLLEQARKVLKESQVGQKGADVSESVLKAAREAVETLEKSADSVGLTAASKNLFEGARTLKQEIDDIILYRAVIYHKPEKLRKRSDVSSFQSRQSSSFEANPDATQLELHKDSKWFKSWKNLTEDNPYMSKFWEAKMKYDESDNIAVRSVRFVTDRVGGVFSSVFGTNETSETLSEIAQIDRDFSLDTFLQLCERDIIPNVLEAISRHDLDVLKDWCTEVAFKQLSYPIEEAKREGLRWECRTLDISRVDFQLAKMIEYGPIIVVSFWSQQLQCYRNPAGDAVRGDPNQTLKVTNTWLLARDMQELNPEAAWRVMEAHTYAQTQLL